MEAMQTLDGLIVKEPNLRGGRPAVGFGDGFVQQPLPAPVQFTGHVCPNGGDAALNREGFSILC